jgi:hypothetical protein
MTSASYICILREAQASSQAKSSIQQARSKPLTTLFSSCDSFGAVFGIVSTHVKPSIYVLGCWCQWIFYPPRNMTFCLHRAVHAFLRHLHGWLGLVVQGWRGSGEGSWWGLAVVFGPVLSQEHPRLEICITCQQYVTWFNEMSHSSHASHYTCYARNLHS